MVVNMDAIHIHMDVSVLKLLCNLSRQTYDEMLKGRRLEKGFLCFDKTCPKGHRPRLICAVHDIKTSDLGQIWKEKPDLFHFCLQCQCTVASEVSRVVFLCQNEMITSLTLTVSHCVECLNSLSF